MSYRSKLCSLLLLCVVPAALLSCDTSVEPLVGEERPFTVWGLLNAGADTQKVRVFPIADGPGIDRSGDIDATVSSIDLTTGEERTWSHRVVTYEDGDRGHVYWSDFRPEEGHRYQIRIARSDGAVSTATVTIPSGVEVTVEPNTTNTKIPVYVRGDVPHLIGVEMRYEATNLPPLNAWPVGTMVHPPVFFPVEIPYADRGERITDGWRFDVDMQQDAELVRLTYERNCLITAGAPGIALRRVEFHFIAADSAWNPPGGTFDPELLVEPGAFSNVENGYGFIGAGEVFEVRWTPPASVRSHLGYEESRPCAGMVGPTPACTNPPIPCIGDNPADIWDTFF
ncbi:MAG: DUF4249 family protein [Rhodothermales bacterium]